MTTLGYLASPYSDPDPEVVEKRYVLNMCAFDTLLSAGTLVFSPLLQSHEVSKLFDTSANWEYWRTIDLEMLARCDMLYVLKLTGWEKSVGVQAEIAFANECEIPIKYIAVDLEAKPELAEYVPFTKGVSEDEI